LANSAPVAERRDKEPVQPAISTGDPTGAITIADVLKALEMEIWKEKVNQPGEPPVRHVALCVKPAGSDAREVMSVDIDNPAQPGTLLVFLQDGRFGEYRYRAGIVYQGADGFGHSTLNVLEDPFKGPHAVRTGDGGRSIARRGIAVLRCSATFAGRSEDIETTAEAAAIYMKNK
jgi:hypothetical protein